MGLFDTPDAPDQSATGKRVFTREAGTRRLVIGFVSLLVLWYGFGFIRDKQLQGRNWAPLAPMPAGLTIVGTLNGKENYDTNIFQVIESNKSAHPQLTEIGWHQIFSGIDPLFSDRAGNAIKAAIDLDSVTGYRMLEPYLRRAMSRRIHATIAGRMPAPDYPVLVDLPAPPHVEKLGTLIDRYSKQVIAAPSATHSDEGGSAGERTDLQRGIDIPGDTLVRVCPVVLTQAQLSGAELDEQDEPFMHRKIYSVTLHLNPEGRSRFYQWSRDHAGEQMVFVLNGQVVTAALVTGAMNVDNWEIRPLPDKHDAEAMVNAVKGAHL